MDLSKTLRGVQFSPIIELPKSYPIFDFSKDYDAEKNSVNEWGIGRYNERRPTMYKGDQYSAEETKKVRNIHMGIDLGAPVGTPVSAFWDGEICFAQNNDRAWDYGPTLLSEHTIKGVTFWLLLGHLSLESLNMSPPGRKFLKGEQLGEVGERQINGGWNPHIHVQLSTRKPKEGDLPGVVSENDHSEALKLYPDPRIILGAIYRD